MNFKPTFFTSDRHVGHERSIEFDKPQSQKILDKQFDVGVTANNYAPVSLSQIESWVMTYGK